VHVVTKILIVCGSILSIFLAALTISFASSADAIKQSVASEQSAKAAALAQLAEVQAGSGSELAAAAKKLSDAEAAKTESDSRLQSLQNERSKLLSELNNVKLEAEKLRSRFAAVDATAQLQAETNKALNDETAKLRAAQLEGAKRETDLVERLNEVESQREVLAQSVRALQEQLAEVKNAMDKSSGSTSGTTTASGKSAPTISTGPLVMARVKSVTKTASGRDLVVISEGASAGLKQNQMLYVIRNNQFIGNLVLSNVAAPEAAGTVDTLGRTVSVQVDDMVLSRIGG
jgi:predicted RNase H-like nuclease (RuvC/YqgF family)